MEVDLISSRELSLKADFALSGDSKVFSIRKDDVREYLFKEFRESLLALDEYRLEKAAKRAIHEDLNINDAIMNGLVVGMKKVSELYEQHQYFIPELLIATDMIYKALNILRPHLNKHNLHNKFKGRIVIGTLKGDFHDIGKNIVKIAFETAGFKVSDLGNDVSPGKFAEETFLTGSQLVAISSMMTPSMVDIRKVIMMIKEKNSSIAIMLGGAPITREMVYYLGADGYAESANKAVEEAIKLVFLNNRSLANSDV